MYSVDKTAGEAKIFCDACEHCRWYDGDTKNKGERMLNQKAIVEGQGWRSCYICLPCVENWLEESGQVEDGGVNERNSF